MAQHGRPPDPPWLYPPNGCRGSSPPLLFPLLCPFCAPQECSFVPGCQPIGVGRNVVIRKALVDKNVRIGDNVSSLRGRGKGGGLMRQCVRCLGAEGGALDGGGGGCLGWALVMNCSFACLLHIKEESCPHSTFKRGVIFIQGRGCSQTHDPARFAVGWAVYPELFNRGTLPH